MLARFQSLNAARQLAFIGIFLCIVLAGVVSAWGAPPPTINIRGQLLDAQRHALSGSRAFQVQFYDADVAGTALGAPITGTAQVAAEGLFNVEVTLPPAALSAVAVWYEFAISSAAAPGPLTGGDTFPNRVKVVSVPFALQSGTVTHVDVPSIGSGAVLDAEFEYLTGLTGNIQTQLNGKAAASHTQDWTTITGKPTTFAPSAHTQDWTTITGKPATFAPSAHAHSGADITSGKVDNAFLHTGANNSLDADSVDGLHASAFATSAHNHDTSYWKLGGNAGTTNGTNYLGTSDNVALDFRANNTRAFRLEPNATSPNVIGGYSGNNVTSGRFGATIGGGGASGALNTVTGKYGTVSGGGGGGASGALNTVTGKYGTVSGGGGGNTAAEGAVVGGGWINQATGVCSVVGGGSTNTASASGATIAGGGGSAASADYATIAGGDANTASGLHATVGGGESNTASAKSATVSGGQENTANNDSATVSGGYRNTAANDATVSGGKYNSASGSDTTVGGGANNAASGNTSTVGGGANNTASGAGASVGGGSYNVAAGEHSTIAGGGPTDPTNNPTTTNNITYGPYCTVGGGGGNVAGNVLNTFIGGATVSGGAANRAIGVSSTVTGGNSNGATGHYSTVCGGFGNGAYGIASFAAGHYANTAHDHCFCWSDGTYTSTEANCQFVARASGGFKFYTNSGSTGVYLDSGAIAWLDMSDRNRKENFEPVDPVAVLEKVAAMPVTTWTVKDTDPSVRYMGPMAQDFYAAFGLGNDETKICTLDADGVALAAIQGVNQKLEEKVAEQDAKLQTLEARIAQLESIVQQLASK